MTRNLIKRLKQVELLKRVSGVQSLLNQAYKLLGNPLLIFDIDNGLIANAEDVTTDDPVWNDFVENGSLGDEMRELFREEGFIDAIINAEAVAFLLSDALRYDRLLGKVLNRSNVHVANLLIVACAKAFEAEDPVIFEAVCQVFSDEINASEFYHHSGKTHEETLIQRLIEGNIADKELYSVRLGILYNGLKDNLFLAVIDTAQRNPEYTSLAHFRDLVAKIRPDFKYSIYSNYIVAILSSDDEALDTKRDLAKLERFFRQKNIRAGISRRFGNLFQLPKYYGEALHLLREGSVANGEQRIFLCDRDEAL